MSAATCRATRLPCCFGCPEPICALVDVHGALDNSEKPPVRQRRRRWWQR